MTKYKISYIFKANTIAKEEIFKGNVFDAEKKAESFLNKNSEYKSYKIDYLFDNWKYIDFKDQILEKLNDSHYLRKCIDNKKIISKGYILSVLKRNFIFDIIAFLLGVALIGVSFVSFDDQRWSAVLLGLACSVISASMIGFVYERNNNTNNFAKIIKDFNNSLIKIYLSYSSLAGYRLIRDYLLQEYVMGNKYPPKNIFTNENIIKAIKSINNDFNKIPEAKHYLSFIEQDFANRIKEIFNSLEYFYEKFYYYFDDNLNQTFKKIKNETHFYMHNFLSLRQNSILDVNTHDRCIEFARKVLTDDFFINNYIFNSPSKF